MQHLKMNGPSLDSVVFSSFDVLFSTFFMYKKRRRYISEEMSEKMDKVVNATTIQDILLAFNSDVSSSIMAYVRRKSTESEAIVLFLNSISADAHRKFLTKWGIFWMTVASETKEELVFDFLMRFSLSCKEVFCSLFEGIDHRLNSLEILVKRNEFELHDTVLSPGVQDLLKRVISTSSDDKNSFSVKLEHCFLVDNELSSLGHILSCRAISHFDLRNNWITFSAMNSGMFSSVEYLDLRSNMITSSTLQSLCSAVLSSGSKMHTLLLGGNLLGNKGLEIICQHLMNSPSLKTLDISSSGITAGGWMPLISLSEHYGKSLYRLDVTGNQWSFSEIVDFHRALVDLGISEISIGPAWGDVAAVNVSGPLSIQRLPDALIARVPVGKSFLRSMQHHFAITKKSLFSFCNFSCSELSAREAFSMLQMHSSNESMLRHLNLSCNQLNTLSFQSTTLHPFLHGIRDLDLSNCKLQQYDIENLFVNLSVTRSQVRNLDLHGNDLSSGFPKSAVINFVTAEFCVLEDLNFSNVKTRQVSGVLSLLSMPSTLQKLVIRQNGLTTENIIDSCTRVSPNCVINEIDMAENSLCDKAALEISTMIISFDLNIKSEKALKIDLSRNDITARGLASFKFAMFYISRVYLTLLLDGNPINEEASWSLILTFKNNPRCSELSFKSSKALSPLLQTLASMKRITKSVEVPMK